MARERHRVVCRACSTAWRWKSSLNLMEVRLQVSVDNAFFVRRLDGLDDLSEEAESKSVT